MKFVDLAAQRLRLAPALEARLRQVLDHGQFILGPEVSELEDALRRRVSATEVVSCASGSDALALGLRALGAGPGDAVFVPSFTYAATASAVCRVGATPVFVDILEHEAELCPTDLGQALDEVRSGRHRSPDGATLRPWGVIAVGLFGFPADIPRLESVTTGAQLHLLEDGAQSLFARRGAATAPAQAELGMTSFFPSKVLGCYGDGGALFCRDAELAQKLRLLRVQGKPSADRPAECVGENSRLDTLQAAVLLTKLETIDQELARRQQIARHYQEALRDLAAVELPQPPTSVTPAWSLFTLRLCDRLAGARSRLMKELSQEGIPSRVYYEHALHQQPAFAPFQGKRQLPRTERLARRVLCLPLHPDLSEADQAHVCATFTRLAKAW